MADTSDVTEEAIEHAWRSVKGPLDEADRCGYRLYSSRYQRGEIEFRMSDGVTLSKSVTLPFREWFKQRGLRFMRHDGLTIKKAIDEKAGALGIAKDKTVTALSR